MADKVKVVTIVVTNALTNPVPLYVHGVGRFSVEEGKQTEVPEEALETLKNSDVEFEVIDLAAEPSPADKEQPEEEDDEDGEPAPVDPPETESGPTAPETVTEV